MTHEEKADALITKVYQIYKGKEIPVQVLVQIAEVEAVLAVAEANRRAAIRRFTP